jgi:hypothetical protein
LKTKLCEAVTELLSAKENDMGNLQISIARTSISFDKEKKKKKKVKFTSLFK